MNNVQQVNFNRFFSGDHKAWTITFYDKANNTLNLNNRRIVFTLKQDIDDSDDNSVLRKVFDISEPTDVFSFVLSLSTEETKDISGVFEYDLRLSFINQPTEIQFTALRGKLTIDKPITNSME